MILAGIDEAGYGPLLGPLVVGCCAFEIEAPCPPSADDLPCLWKALTRLVSKSRSKSGRKLHINDSKQVYSPSIGLGELEKSLLAVALASGIPATSLDDFLHSVAADALADLATHPWYAPSQAERFPLEHELLSLTLIANGLRFEMDRARTRCVHLAARVLPERQLNNLLNQTRNKAGALFSIAAIHLDYLLRNFAAKDLVIFCDRQGGREHYGHLLRLMFEDWPLEIVREQDGHSEYLLHPPSAANAEPAPNPVRLLFKEKAEARCMPVALASMLSKYLRETLMHRFNAFWRQHVPDIAPTAGYYTDGQRFLQDIDTHRKQLGIHDEMLVRCR